MVNDYDDAQDITQAVFIKAFENLKNYKPEFRFYSWIYRIMINETLNWKKKNQTYSELDQNIVSSSKNPEEQFLSNRLSEKVQDAVADLMIDHRVVIVLKHFVALPYSDISYILDIPEKTVKSRLFSARQKLSVILSSSELN
jgi:RNA polymerase sigma-70 factor (ECF subfamily)